MGDGYIDLNPQKVLWIADDGNLVTKKIDPQNELVCDQSRARKLADPPFVDYPGSIFLA